MPPSSSSPPRRDHPSSPIPHRRQVLHLEFLSIPTQVESIQAKIKTLDALPSLLNRVTKALNKFAQVIKSASTKAGDKDVPSAGRASTKPAVGEKNTQQATISQPFQRKAAKDAEKANQNKQQPIPTPPPITTTATSSTTSSLQSLFLLSPPKSSS
ncbi:hypothetical protein Tco_0520530 [Tanacetum coccineum]